MKKLLTLVASLTAALALQANAQIQMVFDEVTTQFYTSNASELVPPVPVVDGNPNDNLMPRKAGGTLYVTTELLDPNTGESKGIGHQLCTITTDGRSMFVPNNQPPFFGEIVPIIPNEIVAWSNCQLVLRLDGGDLVLNGVFEQHSFEAFQPAHYAITGGTGIYKRARGSVTAQQIVFPHTVRLFVNLSLW